MQNVSTFLLNFHKPISINYRHHGNLPKNSSLAHGFLKHTTSKIVTDFLDAEIDKNQRKTIQRLDEPLQYSSKNSSWKIQKNSVTINPKIKPKVAEIIEPSSSSLIDKNQIKQLNLRKLYCNL